MPKIKKKNKIEQCTKIFIYRDLKLYFLLELLCVLLSLYSNQPFYLHSFFSIVRSEQISCSAWITSYPYSHYIFNKRFY